MCLFCRVRCYFCRISISFSGRRPKETESPSVSECFTYKQPPAHSEVITQLKTEQRATEQPVVSVRRIIELKWRERVDWIMCSRMEIT